MDFDMQNAYQSHDFHENLKWSHGQYAHFAPSGFFQTRDKSEVFDRSVEIQFSGNKVKSKNMKNCFG